MIVHLSPHSLLSCLFKSASGVALVLLALLLFSSSAVISCDEAKKDVYIGVIPPDEGGGDNGSGDDDDSPDDNDGDGLSNQVEEVFEMEPLTADSDHDGFDDGLEFVGDDGDPLAAGKSPNASNRSRVLRPEDAVRNDPDRDLDGLGDAYERDNSLNPDSPDMDGDGYQDGLELVARSDPFRSEDRPEREAPPAWDGINRNGPGPLDADGDGLSNDIEALNGTLSNQRDTDSDGFSDGLEYLMGSDGTDFLSIPNFGVPPPPQDNESGDGS